MVMVMVMVMVLGSAGERERARFSKDRVLVCLFRRFCSCPGFMFSASMMKEFRGEDTSTAFLPARW